MKSIRVALAGAGGGWGVSVDWGVRGERSSQLRGIVFVVALGVVGAEGCRDV